ncbi:MAG: RNA ligase (ATP), partial [Erysipelotrichia bacterium]|nr:RNA ligase (ATP) [Erysipelotrichia bacterium]
MRKLATIRRIREVIEIPKAENICLVLIDGWQCVAQKGEFAPNDLCCYFEIDSILPDKPCFEFMRPRKFRVKTIKCMKQLSQGLAKPLSLLKEFTNKQFVEGDDVTDIIGVTKHDPEADQEAKITRP